MEFIDLKEQYRRYKAETDERMQRVIAHAQFVLGPEIAEEVEEAWRNTWASNIVLPLPAARQPGDRLARLRHRPGRRGHHGAVHLDQHGGSIGLVAPAGLRGRGA